MQLNRAVSCVIVGRLGSIQKTDRSIAYVHSQGPVSGSRLLGVFDCQIPHFAHVALLPCRLVALLPCRRSPFYPICQHARKVDLIQSCKLQVHAVHREMSDIVSLCHLVSSPI
jgi:hypothetical protein